MDEAIDNWEKIIGKLRVANLKVTARKVRIFLEDTEVFGHRISNGTVTPSEHNIKSLGETKTTEIKTHKQINSYKGLYKTMSRHLPGMASIRVSHFATKFTNHLAHPGSHLYTPKNEIPKKLEYSNMFYYSENVVGLYKGNFEKYKGNYRSEQFCTFYTLNRFFEPFRIGDCIAEVLRFLLTPILTY